MAERRSLGPLLVAVAVVLLAAVFMWRPFLTVDREVTESTPGPRAIEPSVVPLQPGSEACLDPVTLTPRSEVARLGLEPAERGVPLVFTATAPGYSARVRVPPADAADAVEARIAPPPREETAKFCIRNAGTAEVQLRARGVGRTTARPLLRIDGAEYPADLVLTLRRADPEPVLHRGGEVIERAAGLVPLPSWALWVLGVALVLAVAGGPLLALRLALTAEAPAAAPVPPARPFPLAGRGRRARTAAAAVRAGVGRVPAGVWLALLVLVAAAWLYGWAAGVGNWQNDEEETVYLARWMANNLPGSLWDFELLMRGLQRLEIILLALPIGTMPSPDAFFVGHALNIAIYASSAIPAYLLARGLGLSASWRLFAALLVLATPWVVYATAFLTEPPAYGIWTWTIWAVWRACGTPGARSDLLALAFVALAALTRSGFLVLALLPPLAVVAHQLRFGERGSAPVLLRGLRRANPLVLAATAAGVAAVLASAFGLLPLANLAGAYGTAINLGDEYWGKLASYASRVAVGTGFATFAIGLAWLLARAVSPNDPAAGAFAAVSFLAAALLFFANIPAGPDERYVFYLAPPLAVACAAAFARRDLPAWPVLATAVFAAWLIWRTGWNTGTNAYGFFIGPAESFYARVGLLRLETNLPGWLPTRTGALIVAIGVGLIIAYAFTRGARARSVAAAVVASLVVLQVAQADYTMRRYVTEAGGREPAPAERAWVDRALYGKGRAAVFATSLGNTGGFETTWREIQYWNTSVDQVALTAERGIRTPPGDSVYTLTIDRETGLVQGAPLPDHILVPRTYLDVSLAGTRVAHALYVPVDLVRIERPARARYLVEGPQPDGFLTTGLEVRVRVFTSAVPTGRCLRFPLSVPDDFQGPPGGARWTISFGGERRSGRIANGSNTDVDFALGGRTRIVDGTLRASGEVELADGRQVAAQLGQLQIVDCR